MQNSSSLKIIIATGLALFAMFFGAGNIIFPLKVGAIASDHITPALIAFIISGVGLPFIGVFAISLHEGSYWKLFNRLGRPVSFVVVTFLLLIIGPLFAAPRTEVITYNTLLPMLPHYLQNAYVFSALYFGAIFMLLRKQSRVVDIIGWLFSPVKIISFTLLILVGIYTAGPLIHSDLNASQSFTTSLTMGYGTMDLVAGFFFCSVAYQNVVRKSHALGITSSRAIIKMMLYACLIGASLISLIYAGFIYVAASHAQDLAGVPTEALIGKIASVTLGQYGELFVGVCVTVACMATGATLAEVTTDYLYNTSFKQRVPRIVCLLIVMMIMGMMSILGFDGIMKIAEPILNVLYPILIVFCVVTIYLKLAPKKLGFNTPFNPVNNTVATESE